MQHETMIVVFAICCFLTVSESALTVFHDGSVSLENTAQNVWGRDDDGVKCTGDSAYALVPKSSALTTGLLVSGFGFKNETELQATSRILKVDVRLKASADADRRMATATKFHIGLDSVVLRSGGLDIYSQTFGGEPRPLSATPVQLDFSLEKVLAIGSMLFRGDQVLSEQFGIVTYWRNHDNTSSWYVYLDCVQARLLFENDVPTTPSPPPRPTSTVVFTPSTSSVVLLTTATIKITSSGADSASPTNSSSSAALFTVQDQAPDTLLALDTETVIAIVVPVAAACVLIITVGIICILRRRKRGGDRKRSSTASSPAKGKSERKETVRVQNNAFEGTIPNFGSVPDAAESVATPPIESPRPPEPATTTPVVIPVVMTSAVAKSVALPAQPEKQSQIVIASYPNLAPAAAPAGVIFVERGYEMPYSFDNASQQIYMGEHGIAADFTPAVGREAHANMMLDRHVRDQYQSAAKQNQVLDDIF